MVDVNVEADGSTTFEGAEAGGQEEAFTGGENAGGEETFAGAEGGEEAFEEVAKSIDPAIYLLIAVAIFLIGFVIYQRKKKEEDEDDFFSNLDGEKVRKLICALFPPIFWQIDRGMWCWESCLSNQIIDHECIFI
jgi:hypothetical protein